MYVSKLFASESCKGRSAQMRSDHAQPFANVKAWGRAGWSRRDVQRDMSFGGQHLLCTFIGGPMVSE